MIPEQQYVAFSAQPTFLQQPEWVQAMRRQGLETFQQLGFPQRKQEEWRYTPLTPLLQHMFQVAPAEVGPIAEKELAPYLFGDFPRLVFINGHYQPHLSTIPVISAGAVTITPLQQALQQGSASLVMHFNQQVDVLHGFTALNNGLFMDGAFIHVSEKMRLSMPIHVLFIATTADCAWMNQVRNLIIAEPDSQLSIIEHYIGCNGQVYWNNVVTEVHVANRAHVEHYKIQQEGKQGAHIGTVFAHVQNRGHFNSYSFALGGQLVRSDTLVKQVAPSIHCRLNGFYLAQDAQHIEHHTLVEHAHPGGISDEFYKGIALDQARTVFNGRVIVQPVAQQTHANQINKNLVLSEGAEANTKPELQIYADDVRCSHGATVGQLDEQPLFYLRARGIAEEDARHLLILAFAMDVIAQWPLAAAREYAERLLYTSLHR